MGAVAFPHPLALLRVSKQLSAICKGPWIGSGAQVGQASYGDHDAACSEVVNQDQHVGLPGGTGWFARRVGLDMLETWTHVLSIPPPPPPRFPPPPRQPRTRRGLACSKSGQTPPSTQHVAAARNRNHLPEVRRDQKGSLAAVSPGGQPRPQRRRDPPRGQPRASSHQRPSAQRAEGRGLVSDASVHPFDCSRDTAFWQSTGALHNGLIPGVPWQDHDDSPT